MRFIPIFYEPNGKLFTVHYDNEERDAFQQLFENWPYIEELWKLNRVISELKEQGIYDADGLTDN